MTGPDQLSQTVQTVRILWFMGLKQMRGCVATFKNSKRATGWVDLAPSHAATSNSLLMH